MSSNYVPSVGAGLNVLLSSGSVLLNGVATSYPGGSVALLPVSENFVYLDPVTGQPASTVGGFPAGAIPICHAVTSAFSVVIIKDVRAEAVGGVVAPVLKVLSVTLSSAQLLALKATPVTIVAAPGAGLAIIPEQAIIEFVPATTPYTTSGTLAAKDLSFTYAGNGAIFATDSLGLVDQTASKVILVTPAMPTSGRVVLGSPSSQVKNAAVTLANVGSAELTAGDGTLIVTFYYAVASLT